MSAGRWRRLLLVGAMIAAGGVAASGSAAVAVDDRPTDPKDGKVCFEEQKVPVYVTQVRYEKQVKGNIQTKQNGSWENTGSFDWEDWPNAGPLEWGVEPNKLEGSHSGKFEKSGSGEGATRKKTTDFRYVVVGERKVQDGTAIVKVEVPCPIPASTLGLTYNTDCPVDDTNTWRIRPKDVHQSVRWELQGAPGTYSGVMEPGDGEFKVEAPRQAITATLYWDSDGDGSLDKKETKAANANDLSGKDLEAGEKCNPTPPDPIVEVVEVLDCQAELVRITTTTTRYVDGGADWVLGDPEVVETTRPLSENEVIECSPPPTLPPPVTSPPVTSPPIIEVEPSFVVAPATCDTAGSVTFSEGDGYEWVEDPAGVFTAVAEDGYVFPEGFVDIVDTGLFNLEQLPADDESCGVVAGEAGEEPAPVPTTEAPADPQPIAAPAPATPTGTLPSTGSGTGETMGLAALIGGLGIGLIALSRRRPEDELLTD